MLQTTGTTFTKIAIPTAEKCRWEPRYLRISFVVGRTSYMEYIVLAGTHATGNWAPEVLHPNTETKSTSHMLASSHWLASGLVTAWT